MNSFLNDEYPYSGQLIIMFMSDGTVTVTQWKFAHVDWNADVIPIGWVEDNEENRTKHLQNS